MRRLRDEQIRKDCEAAMNRWMFIAFIAVSIAEIGSHFLGVW